MRFVRVRFQDVGRSIKRTWEASLPLDRVGNLRTSQLLAQIGRCSSLRSTDVVLGPVAEGTIAVLARRGRAQVGTIHLVDRPTGEHQVVEGPRG